MPDVIGAINLSEIVKILLYLPFIRITTITLNRNVSDYLSYFLDVDVDVDVHLKVDVDITVTVTVTVDLSCRRRRRCRFRNPSFEKGLELHPDPVL